MRLWVAMLMGSALMVSGCSSMIPFQSKKMEDLNALTYGDDYQRRDWVDEVSVSSQRARERMNQTRGLSSVEGAAQDLENANRELDPTSAEVQERIMMERGRVQDSLSRTGRATKEDFMDLRPNDGSLWSNEQDSNYFFTKEKVRRVGDIVSVKLDENMLKSIAEETKKTLTPAEQEVELALYLKNNRDAIDNKDLQAYKKIEEDDLHNDEAMKIKARMEKAVRWSQVDLSKALQLSPSEELRAEIVNRFQNGNYLIRLQKKVLYRGSSRNLSMVAIAPAQDFDDKDQIIAGKLYDTKIRMAR